MSAGIVYNPGFKRKRKQLIKSARATSTSVYRRILALESIIGGYDEIATRLLAGIAVSPLTNMQLRGIYPCIGFDEGEQSGRPARESAEIIH